ncbi:agmatine deiminase [Cryptosporangium aurantiacum]|uniref:Agmatine deiminase n=2 Tax=Cryptosporangium aurantiacum TaxID=134849 RepID=A0A1M7Q3Q9_9ACTN|nr:agmatine deiminase [Cryptosporangium aurantiacum]
MAFPTPNATFEEDGSPALDAARAAWAAVANVIVAYEPVRMLVNASDKAAARSVLDPRVHLIDVELDDAWLRDSGPTFVHDLGGSDVASRAVAWRFNGWGAQSWAAWGHDRHLGTRVARSAGVEVDRSTLTQEGGGFHVDGEGTVLLTETVQLDPDRNPGWSRTEVETEIHQRLGTTTAIWLPRGLTADYDEFGTRGHVDVVATFTRPGTVVVHTQPDPGHPDHEPMREVAEILRTAVDARGRRLEVVELPSPTVADYDGRPVDHSYVNHYLGNNVVVGCAFDDPRDATAAAVLADVYPGRDVVLVDARDIFRFGGGVHCITQQQPAVPSPG